MSPVISQEGRTGAERISAAKTAVQSAIHQGTALGHGQTHVAQAANHRPEQIGGQVVWRLRRGCKRFWSHASDRGSHLVAQRSERRTELLELRQMRLALAAARHMFCRPPV